MNISTTPNPLCNKFFEEFDGLGLATDCSICIALGTQCMGNFHPRRMYEARYIDFLFIYNSQSFIT